MKLKVLDLLDEPTRRRAFHSAVYVSLSSALVAVMLQLIGQGVELSPGSPSYFIVGAAFVFSVGATYWLLRHGATGVTNQLEGAMLALRLRTTERVASADLRAIERTKDVEVAHTRDVEQVGAFFDRSVPFLQLAMMFIPSVILMAFKSIYAVLAVMLTTALILPWLITQFRRSRESARQVSQASSSFQTLVGQMLEGFKQVKLDERAAQSIAEDLSARCRRLTQERLDLDESMRNTLVGGSRVLLVSTAVILFVVPANVDIEASTLYDLALSLNLMDGPVLFLASQAHMFVAANVAHQSLAALEARLAPERVAPAPEASASPADFQRITMRDVTFSYGEGEPGFTVGPIDIDFGRGELIFITGGNGSGKTTLMKLLAGLYTPQSGEILLDGEPVGPSNRERFRSLFTVIFSDQHLFQKPYGVKADDPARVQALLERFSLDRVTRLEGGRFTSLDLSTGQAKRLAMVIALLEDRPIFLLDEWAAHQDPELRRFYYTELLQELKARGKTIIAVSHDDRFFHLADRRITLQNGHIRFDAPADGGASGSEGQDGAARDAGADAGAGAGAGDSG